MKNLRLTGARVVTGAGALDTLGELEFTRAMIVTGGRSMFRNGHDRPRARTARSPGRGLGVQRRGREPDAGRGRKGASRHAGVCADLVIAIGGGSADRCRQGDGAVL